MLQDKFLKGKDKYGKKLNISGRKVSLRVEIAPANDESPEFIKNVVKSNLSGLGFGVTVSLI